MKRIFALTFTALVLLTGLATAATAGHGKTVVAPAKTRTAVLKAIVSQHQLSRAQARCQIVLLDRSHRTWAESTWREPMTRACLKVAANGVIIEHHVNHRWHFATVGSGFVCPIRGVPTHIARDFGLCGNQAAGSR